MLSQQFCYHYKSPQWGTAGPQIKIPSVEDPELKSAPFKVFFFSKLYLLGPFSFQTSP